MRQNPGMRLSRLAALAVALLALAGCEQKVVVGGKPSPKQINRVASLSPGTTEVISLYAERVNLVGKTAACNYPTDFPDVPVVADVKPNYEKLAQIKPDLIVFDASLYGEADIAKLEQLGIETWKMDVRTIDGFIDWLQRTGAKMGSEIKFGEYADKIYAAKQLAMGRAQGTKPKVAVLMGDPGTSYMIAGTGAFVADVIRASGGDPIGPDARNFVAVNAESLVTQAPDIIVTNSDPDQMMKDPQLRGTPAVKSGAIAGVSGDVLLRTGQRIDTLIDNLSKYFQAWRANQ